MPQFDSGAAEPIGRFSEGLLLRLLHWILCRPDENLSANILDNGKTDILIDGRVNGSKYQCPMYVGYARVSTSDQDLALQLDALKKTGCERIFTDHASGARTDRPGLKEALSYVRDGDVLVVWKFDRLGRSLPHLVETITDLNARRTGLRSLTENIDTTTPGGRLIFHVFGALAAFERDLVKERTMAGTRRRRYALSAGRAPTGRHAQQA